MEPWKHSTLTRMWNCSYANRNNNLEPVGSGGKIGRITQPGYLHQISLVGIKDLSQQLLSEYLSAAVLFLSRRTIVRAIQAAALVWTM